MLDVFRENLRSLKWILLLVVASFVVAIFAVWGGGITGGGAGGQSWAASVDGRTIPVQDVLGRARRLDAAYRQLFGPEQYERQRQNLDLVGQALEALIEEELLLAEGRRMGVRVTDGELQDEIRRHPDLQENGRFIGRDRYLNLARAGTFDVRQFEEGIRRGLLLDRARGLLEDGIRVSEAEVREEFRRRNERISADYLVVAPEAIAPRVEVTDAEVEAAYDIRQEAYREPERREGEFVELLTRDVGAAIQPTEEQIRAHYEENLATRYALEDQRRARHILLRLEEGAPEAAGRKREAEARRLLERIRAGEDFADLAREHSEDTTAERGGDLGYFGRGRMVPEFERVVWELGVGEVSEPVRTAFGYHLIQVLDAQAKRVQSFEEVRDRIRNLLRFQMILEETSRRLRELRERMGNEAGFQRVAEEVGLEIRTTGLVTAAAAIEGVPGSSLLVRQLFQLGQGEISEPVTLPTGQALLVHRKTVPGEIPALATIRERVAADARADKARNWLIEKARASARTDPPRPIADLAAEVGLQALRAQDVQRGSDLPDLPGTAGAVERSFLLAEGGWLDPEPLPDGGTLVLQVTGKSGDPDRYAAERETISRNLIALKRQAHFRSVLQRLREESRIVRSAALASTTVAP